mmetsp:Transcript_21301/g.55595  ORF Transcript_21301/g.55595 Transcript_21301/m.55595 type:complete len:228 (+) Transcript_21301:147-830(+)
MPGDGHGRYRGSGSRHAERRLFVGLAAARRGGPRDPTCRGQRRDRGRGGCPGLHGVPRQVPVVRRRQGARGQRCRAGDLPPADRPEGRSGRREANSGREWHPLRSLPLSNPAAAAPFRGCGGDCSAAASPRGCHRAAARCGRCGHAQEQRRRPIAGGRAAAEAAADSPPSARGFLRAGRLVRPAGCDCGGNRQQRRLLDPRHRQGRVRADGQRLGDRKVDPLVYNEA